MRIRTRTKIRVFFLAAALLLARALGVPAEALAADGASRAEPKVVMRKSEDEKFSGLKLKGQLKKPELSYIYKRNGLRAEKIVNIPENFNEEIIQDSGRF